MNDPQPSRRPQASDETINARSVAVTAITAALGAIAGAMAASKLPSDKFAWTGFALAPLFVLLELLLKQLAMVFGGDRNATRLTLAGALVVGFYAAWFGVRAL
jgi:uncharacterized membrane protein YfcA